MASRKNFSLFCRQKLAITYRPKFPVVTQQSQKTDETKISAP